MALFMLGIPVEGELPLLFKAIMRYIQQINILLVLLLFI
jgi:hypothetical protein